MVNSTNPSDNRPKRAYDLRFTFHLRPSIFTSKLYIRFGYNMCVCVFGKSRCVYVLFYNYDMVGACHAVVVVVSERKGRRRWAQWVVHNPGTG